MFLVLFLTIINFYVYFKLPKLLVKLRTREDQIKTLPYKFQFDSRNKQPMVRFLIYIYTRGVYKTKTEDPKTEDRRPKNEELINFRPFKLKAVVIRLKYFMGRYHTRNRLGLRFVV